MTLTPELDLKLLIEQLVGVNEFTCFPLKYDKVNWLKVV